MQLTIDRSIWYRGKESIGSALLTMQGKMCCLGFYAKACGYSDKEIEDIPDPRSLYGHMCGNTRVESADVELDTKLDKRLFIIEPHAYTCDTNGNVASSHFVHNSELCGKLMDINDSSRVESEEKREAELKDLFKQIDVEVEFIN